jgi:hypothetical protein
MKPNKTDAGLMGSWAWQGEMWFFWRAFLHGLSGGWKLTGALKSVQTVSLRSLPVARLAAGTLAFHGLIRSRLGRLGLAQGLSDPCVDTTMQ